MEVTDKGFGEFGPFEQHVELWTISRKSRLFSENFVSSPKASETPSAAFSLI